mgnify:CR=1 FL=1
MEHHDLPTDRSPGPELFRGCRCVLRLLPGPQGGGPAVDSERIRRQVASLDGDDSDNDGFANGVEITDTINFDNTPTFPGLTPSNVGQVTSVDIAEIQDHLRPSSGDDTTPPVTNTYLAMVTPIQSCSAASSSRRRPRGSRPGPR